MPLSAAIWSTRSACAMYASFGVRKSPGVVNGSSPARLRGGSCEKQYSIEADDERVEPLAAAVLDVVPGLVQGRVRDQRPRRVPLQQHGIAVGVEDSAPVGRDAQG